MLRLRSATMVKVMLRLRSATRVEVVLWLRSARLSLRFEVHDLTREKIELVSPIILILLVIYFLKDLHKSLEL